MIIHYAPMLDGRKLAILNQPGLTTNILAHDAEGAPNHKTRIEIHHPGSDRPRFDSIIQICQADLTPPETGDLMEVLLLGLRLVCGEEIPK